MSDKNLDIILVNPPLTLQERYGELGAAGTDTAPLGLCYLAAQARANGFSVEILDAPPLGLTPEETVDVILEKGATYVGIEATVIAINRADFLSRQLKEKTPDTKIILGGPQITANPIGTMNDLKGIDIGVFGEGEVTFIELLNTLRGNGDLDKVNGLILRKGEEVVLTESREYIKELDTLAKPAWDLLPQPLGAHYKAAVFATKQSPAFSLVTSRGCFGQCIFCDKAVFGSKCRWHSAEYVFDMMKTLYYDYGIREFAIADDLFIVFKERVFELCRMIKESNMKMTWSCNSRADYMNEDLLKAMKESGCWQIAYGIESASDEILKNIKKGLDVQRAGEVIKLTHKYGIRVKGFFMFGCPGETVETMKKTMDFVQDVGIDDFQLTYFTPMPGSSVYAQANEIGTLKEGTDSLNYWKPSFVPNTLTPEELEYYYKLAYRKQYFRLRTVVSYLSMVRSPRHLWRLMQGAYHLAVMVFSGLFRKKNKNKD